MPVLLDSTAAPSLAALLAQLQAASGLQCIVPDSFAERVEQLKIRGLGSLEQAGAAELSFLANPKLGHLLAKTRAAAVFLRADDLHALESGQVAYEFYPWFVRRPILLTLFVLSGLRNNVSNSCPKEFILRLKYILALSWAQTYTLARLP